MYAKLALRNACRSLRDYVLYLVTLLVLTVLISFSNLLSCSSDMIDGMQAGSLPSIIALIMAILLHYINGFMLRRRGRELATYTLLGMDKRTISILFFTEAWLLGMVCFIVGTVIGSLLFFFTIHLSPSGSIPNELALYGQAALASLLYFTAVQLVCGILSFARISKLQINQLMIAGRKNEGNTKNTKPILWSVLLGVSFGIYLLLLWLITNDVESTLAMLGISMISIPALFSVFAFYQCFFLWLNWIRKHKRGTLYRNNRIYLMAASLSRFKTDARLYAVLSICLLFSAASFTVGMVMPAMPSTLLSLGQAKWMSFVQICLSITFIVIYFSLLSVTQIIHVQDSRHGIRLMGYLGRSKIQLQGLLLGESCLRFTIPMLACVLLLSAAIAPVNSMLQAIFSQGNIILKALCVFALCFCSLYASYLIIVYRLCKRTGGLHELKAM